MGRWGGGEGGGGWGGWVGALEFCEVKGVGGSLLEDSRGFRDAFGDSK